MTKDDFQKLFANRADVTPGGVSGGDPYFAWGIHEERACLDGEFTASQLFAIATWMRERYRPAPVIPPPPEHTCANCGGRHLWCFRPGIDICEKCGTTGSPECSVCSPWLQPLRGL